MYIYRHCRSSKLKWSFLSSYRIQQLTRTCDDVLSSSAKSKISSHLYLALEELKAKIKATKKSIVGKDVYMVIFSLTRVCIKMRIKD